MGLFGSSRNSKSLEQRASELEITLAAPSKIEGYEKIRVIGSGVTVREAEDRLLYNTNYNKGRYLTEISQPKETLVVGPKISKRVPGYEIMGMAYRPKNFSTSVTI